MTFLRGAFALGIAISAGCLTLAAEPLGTPEEGIVVLRNGQVLQGQIDRVGEQITVHVAVGAKVHLPAAEVDLVCRTLDEAYQRKRRYVEVDNARGHLDLAEWCLRQGLMQQAGEQVSAAYAADSEEPRIAAVERRWREAVEAPQPARHVAAKAPAPRRTDDLEQTMRSVPAGAVERFTSSVQPLLLNRCATSGCHGTTSKSSFKLLRPAAGDTITQRYTQRNLQAVLKTIDRDAPEASPLLTAPRGPHGTSAAPVFGHRDERQHEQLLQWVKQVSEPSAARKAASLAASEPRPEPAEEFLGPRAPRRPPVPRATPAAMNTLPQRPAAAERVPQPFSAPPASKPIAQDPFDPDQFNRRFFGEKE